MIVMRRVLSVLFWAFFALSGLVCLIIAFTLWIFTTPFDRQRRINHAFSCRWAALYARVYPGWTVRVTGQSNILPRRAYVMVANHTSMADIVLLFCLFRQFKWVSKASVFSYPIFGWNMRMCRYVPLVRGEKGSIETMMQTCADWLRHQMPIMMFPEGTRSKDGRLKPFKRGAFALAHETQSDIVPIAIHGGHRLIPKHQTTFATHADLWVEVLPPIAVEAGMTVEALSEASREAIRQALAADPDEPEHAYSTAHEAVHA
ncbi:MAG: lysophospholipid acyltransferase family protein [Myxococcota bacterium]